MRDLLTELSGALAGREHLLDDFSYADIAMACALQQVAPVDDRFIPLTPGMRRCTTDPELAAEFAAAVAWRDRLYERFR
jgi:glutathione S-transferase